LAVWGFRVRARVARNHDARKTPGSSALIGNTRARRATGISRRVAVKSLRSPDNFLLLMGEFTGVFLRGRVYASRRVQR
jgi:hypothetical protein